MEYRIVRISHKVDFENEINRLLKEGWKLHGPTFLDNYSGGAFTQPMVRDDNIDEIMLSENTKIDNILRKFCTKNIIEVGADKDD